jgi:hypothetical protein
VPLAFSHRLAGTEGNANGAEVGRAARLRGALKNSLASGNRKIDKPGHDNFCL